MKHNRLPERLRVQWLCIRRVSQHNYPRAMQLAAAWGAALVEWELGEEA